jgi:quercetin dioxygenase-like cupin family protein
MSSLLPAEHDMGPDWLAGSAAAGDGRSGRLAVVERVARAGAMAPLHRRDETETYRVLEGRVTFFVGSDVVIARAGDVVVAQPGAARTFRVESASARWLVHTTVTSLERFADFARATSTRVSAPGAGWPCAQERSSVASIAAANGIEILGPPGALPGVPCAA